MVAAQAGWLDLSNGESPEFAGRVIALSERVVPTTIEEYRILLVMGDYLGEQGMSPCDCRSLASPKADDP